MLRLQLTAALAMCAHASIKQGWVADGCTGSGCPDGSLLTSATWYYDYSIGSPYGYGTVPSTGAAFIPMLWCTRDNTDAVPNYVDTTWGECAERQQKFALPAPSYLPHFD